MNPYATKAMQSSSSRAHGRDDSPFLRALRTRFYRDPGGKSTGGIAIYVHGPHGRQCAGYVVVDGGRRILRKTKVRQAAHYCRKHGGYGVELDALRQAQRLGAQAVLLVFEDVDRVFEAPLSSFTDYGIRDTLGGFHEQCFLPLNYWRDLSDPQGGLFEGVSGP